MRVLLPPSEGKASGGEGPALDLAALSFPALTATRRRVLAALRQVCAGPPGVALGVLGLGPGQREELERNRRLRTAGTLPASHRYTGVLYDALDLPGLPADAAARAAESVVICSALWGALRVDDPIPPYRLSGGVRLPPLGPLAALWRPALTAAAADIVGDGLVLDLRSAPYAAAWRPTDTVAERVVAVRVLAERTVDGVRKRSIVSHHNKATKGRLTRDLLLAGADPATPKDLCEALADLGHTVERPDDPPTGRPLVIDVVIPG